jgi:hypothetical protein
MSSGELAIAGEGKEAKGAFTGKKDRMKNAATPKLQGMIRNHAIFDR